MKKLLFSILLCSFAIFANAQVARVIDLAADSIYSPDTVFHQQQSTWKFSFSNFGQDTIKAGDTLIWRLSADVYPFPGPTFSEYNIMILNKIYDVSDTIGFEVTMPAHHVQGSFDGLICITGFLRNGSSDSISSELTTSANNQECRTIRFEGTNVSIKQFSSTNPDFKMFPNPASTNLDFSCKLNTAATVVIRIMDLTGKEISTFVNGTQSAGEHAMSFDISTLAPGMYMTQIQIGESVKTEKLIINR